MSWGNSNVTISKNLRNWLIAFAVLIILWVIIVAIIAPIPTSRRAFSIFGAPIIEELFKALVAYPILFVYIGLKYGRTPNWRNMGIMIGLPIGFIAGLMVGFFEGVGQGESIQNTISAMVTLSILGAAIAPGISSYLLTKKKVHMFGIFIAAVFTHGLWNYQVFYPSDLARLIWAILMLAIIPTSVLAYIKITEGRRSAPG